MIKVIVLVTTLAAMTATALVLVDRSDQPVERVVPMDCDPRCCGDEDRIRFYYREDGTYVMEMRP